MVPLEINWLILDTDYDSFMSAYACMDFLWPFLPPVKIELGWLFTREPNPPKDVVSTVVIMYRSSRLR